jgi:Zn finger protein HypA/HybF involved in hydrogenase expression
MEENKITIKDVLKMVGELKEKPTTFEYHRGNIINLGAEPSDEEVREGIQDSIERGLCPRCDKPLEEDQEFCPNCGARKIQISNGSGCE